MKKLLALALALIMIVGTALSMTGCVYSKTGKPDYFKVGAIYITSKSDTAGYTYAHHQGIVKAMEFLKLDPEKDLLIVDNVAEDKQQVLTAIDTLVGQGADIIFGISFGYIDAMEEAAAKYPDVIFSHATGYKSNETNFNNYFGRAYQARYLAGVAAGLKSLEIGNDNIGYVAAYGTEYAETASGINGFALGAQAVNPNAKVYVKTLGAWADETNESAYAKELIDAYGCGIISQHCDSAQPQIAAEAAGVFGCGYNSDMTKDAPAAHLTAAIWNWEVYYKKAIFQARECKSAGSFVSAMETSAYYGGLKEGFVAVSELSENCAAGTQAAIDEVTALIVKEKNPWDVFSGVKLTITVAEDGTVTVEQVDAALVDSEGNEIVAAGGASVADDVIKGSMLYFVAGVELV